MEGYIMDNEYDKIRSEISDLRKLFESDGDKSEIRKRLEDLEKRLANGSIEIKYTYNEPWIEFMKGVYRGAKKGYENLSVRRREKKKKDEPGLWERLPGETKILISFLGLVGLIGVSIAPMAINLGMRNKERYLAVEKIEKDSYEIAGETISGKIIDEDFSTHNRINNYNLIVKINNGEIVKLGIIGYESYYENYGHSPNIGNISSSRINYHNSRVRYLEEKLDIGDIILFPKKVLNSDYPITNGPFKEISYANITKVNE